MRVGRQVIANKLCNDDCLMRACARYRRRLRRVNDRPSIACETAAVNEEERSPRDDVDFALQSQNCCQEVWHYFNYPVYRSRNRREMFLGTRRKATGKGQGRLSLGRRQCRSFSFSAANFERVEVFRTSVRDVLSTKRKNAVIFLRLKGVYEGS